MSELVAIAYPDEAAVTRAEANLAEAIHAGLIDVEDVVVIVRDEDGTVDVRQGSTGVGPAAVGGAMWGGLIGLVFLAPLLGMAVGALAASTKPTCVREYGRRCERFPSTWQDAGDDASAVA